MSDATDLSAADLISEHRGYGYQEDTVLSVTLNLDAGERTRLRKLLKAGAASKLLLGGSQPDDMALVLFVELEIAKAERTAKGQTP